MLLLALAACGPLPRPFQPEVKDANPLIDIEDGRMVHVLPIVRGAPGDPTWAAEALADALRSRNLPATTKRPGATAQRLRGRAVIQEINAHDEEILLYWELQDPSGTRIATYSQRGRLPKGTWRSKGDTKVVELFEATADAIAGRIQVSHVTSSQAVPGFPGARLVILPIRSAPGDGSLSLAQALAEELSKAGMPLADYPGARDLLIACDLSLSPPGGYWRQIKLSWVVNDTKTGRELGRIDQASQVPAQQLEGPWGNLSTEIAQGAAAGILDLLYQLGPAS